MSERATDTGRLEHICSRLLSGRNVLEIACGTGLWTEVAATVADWVLATDINWTMLREAKKRLCGRQNTSLVMADAYRLPIQPHKFGAGLAAWWISHIDKRKLDAFLRDFHRCLSPGAVVVLMDDTSAVAEQSAGADAAGNEYVARKLKSGRQFEIIKNGYTETILRDLLLPYSEELSFVQLQYHWITTYKLPTAPCPASEQSA